MKNILLIKNIIIIVVTLFIAIFIFKTAPYYEPREKFEEGVTRLVVDSKDITNSIKNNVFVEDDVIMMPSSLSKKYFNIIYQFIKDQKSHFKNRTYLIFLFNNNISSFCFSLSLQYR